MNRTAHPLFSPLGCLGGALLILGILIAVLLSGGAIFSPGALTVYAEGQPLKGFASHADFENDCTQCHEAGVGVTADRCEVCHTVQANERRTATGLHGKLDAAQAGRCGACHPDHRGRDFDANAHAIQTFDHADLGFSLAHHVVGYDNAALACENCHTGLTFSFEPASCVNCHGDNDKRFMADHVKAFGPTCIDCHDGVDKTSSFDHSQTDFALDGQHAQVDCAGCHTPQVPAADTPTDCASCHEEPDVHKSAFAETDCSVCHTPDSWKPARLGDRPAFNHGQTAFSLMNHASDFAGAALTCAGCHPGSKTGDFATSDQSCADCHGNHDQSFMAEHVGKYGPNCASCHNGAGNMTGFDHAKVFVLDGAHTGVDCAACHKEQVFRDTPSACSGCHAEPPIHAGVFGLQCDACHTTSAWAPAQLIRHNFPLDHGGKGEIACASCHTQSYVAYTCAECHVQDDMTRAHAALNLTATELADCMACHPLGLTVGKEKP